MRYIEVKTIIDEWDPLNLWSCMCPPDEYDSEIVEIRDKAMKCNDVAQLGKFIQDTCGKKDINECNSIAERILALDKSEIKPYYCPLVNRHIDDHYCSNINMVAHGSVSPKNRMFQSDKIEVETAKSHCLECANIQIVHAMVEKNNKYSAGIAALLKVAEEIISDKDDNSEKKLDDQDFILLNKIADKMKEDGYLHPEAGVLCKPIPINLEDAKLITAWEDDHDE